MATQTYTNGVTLTDATEFNNFDTAAYSALTSVSGTNAITATGPANFALTSRIPFSFIPANTTTAATTLNISGTGVKNIYSGGVATVGGEIVAGVPCVVIYDGTQYNIISSRTLRGSFTATLTGCTTSPTATAVYSITNNVVTLFIPALAATSNTTACTITGLPAAVRPTTDHTMIPAVTQDNTSVTISACDVSSAGVLTLRKGTNCTPVFTSSGTKGLGDTLTITYNLN